MTATRTPPARLAAPPLPVDAHLGEKMIVGGRRRLVDDRFAAVAVVAGRRLAHEHARRRRRTRACRRRGSWSRACGCRGSAASPLGEALVDVLADEVDDARRRRRTRRQAGARRPGPRRARDRRVGRARPLPGRAQRPTTSSPRASSASQTGDPISPLAPVSETRISPAFYPLGRYSSVENVPVSSETRAMPSRRASSTTALATAGATSRSKTEGMM